MTPAFDHQPPRNFDFFRVIDAQAEVKVSEAVFRKWTKRKKGEPVNKFRPKIYRMKGEKVSFGRYSEVERFVMENSEVLE